MIFAGGIIRVEGNGDARVKSRLLMRTEVRRDVEDEPILRGLRGRSGGQQITGPAIPVSGSAAHFLPGAGCISLFQNDSYAGGGKAARQIENVCADAAHNAQSF